MSRESVQKFYELLQRDAAVVEELKKAGEGVETAENAVAVVAAFAKEKGFEFTAEDLAAFEQESQKELSLEELDKINGGGWGACFIAGGGEGDATGLGATNCSGFGWGFGITWNDFDKDAANREYKDKKVNPLQDNNSKYGVR